jgi:hypothetical protein
MGHLNNHIMSEINKKSKPTQNIPDPKKHQIISFIKSGLRLTAGLFGAFGKFEIGFGLLFLAEIFGVYEELV